MCVGPVDIRSALKDWGSNVGGVVKTDASAVWGKVRRIDIAFLYVQNFAVAKTLDFVKTLGTANLADMCTKGLTQDGIHKYLYEVNMRFCHDREYAAAKLDGSAGVR